MLRGREGSRRGGRLEDWTPRPWRGPARGVRRLPDPKEIILLRRQFKLAGLSALLTGSLAAFALAGVLGVSLAGAQTGAMSVRLAHVAGGGAKIALRSTSMGKVLVNGRGFTLYAFSK